MTILIKICGLKTRETLDAALDAGADMVGFVFVIKSPRNIFPAEAEILVRRVPTHVQKVALLVEPGDETIGDVIAAIQPNLLQLHGRETPARVNEIKEKFGIPVMKAIGVAVASDLAAIAPHAGIADRILIDAKPPKDAAYPGGHGRPFDWSMLEASLDPMPPFMLSGGLDARNVAEAIRRTRPAGVDVSSGVESAPGVKDAARIAAFIEAAREA